METKKKKIYIEVLRILATILVILNHTPVYFLFAYSEGAQLVFYTIQTIITKINVPLFLMISGATLLGKEEDYAIIFKKRILRIIEIIFIFNFISYLITAIQINSFNILEYINLTLSNEVEGTIPYWYLYAYLAFLFMLPFIRKIATKLTRMDIIVMITLYFVFYTFIQTISDISLVNSFSPITLSSYFSIPIITSSIIFYPLIGYYLDKNINANNINKKTIFMMLFVYLSTIIVSFALTYYEGNKIGEFSQKFVDMFDFIQAIIIFVLINYFVNVISFNMFNEKLYKKICALGSLTFGIYLFDPILQKLFFWKYNALVKPPLPTIFVSYGWILLSMMIGGLLTYLLKKYTFFKKIL